MDALDGLPPSVPDLLQMHNLFYLGATGALRVSSKLAQCPCPTPPTAVLGEVIIDSWVTLYIFLPKPWIQAFPRSWSLRVEGGL